MTTQKSAINVILLSDIVGHPVYLLKKLNLTKRANKQNELLYETARCVKLHVEN